MKRLASIAALALAIAFGAAGTAEAGAKNKAARADKAGKRDQAGVAGVVASVTGTNISVQTRGKKGGEIVIATDETTKFEGVASLADVKAGMHVVATPITGTAQKVVVQAGRAGKAARGAKKAKIQ